MIDFVEGNLAELTPAYAVIETNGVGYHLNITLNTYEQLNGKKSCKLFTKLVIRDDAHELFGFMDREERQLFMLLRTVSKIGPNVSRMILSSLKQEELKNAILNNDVALINTIKGVGQKTAQRIVVELRDKIQKSEEDVTISGVSGLPGSEKRPEAVNALVTLGFNKLSAEKAVAKLLKDNGNEVSVEFLVKEALKKL